MRLFWYIKVKKKKNSHEVGSEVHGKSGESKKK